MKTFLVAGVLLALTGTPVQQMPPPAAVLPSAAAVPSTGTDNLIIYRAHAEPTAWSPAIKVDGIKIVGLSNRHYTSTRVATGRHMVTVAWPGISGQDDVGMEVRIEGQEAHYLEVTGMSRVDHWSYKTVYIRMASGIAEVSPDYARQAIATCCKFKAPK
ncbi:hypothetical protein [Sphingomonas sp.]|uniref:hypothetical protein n=1 Tax=Sphingomonas sp. TaxID=28214 RepID=UPI0025FAB9EE|nr:hypothetical protein [Sphingomonas sp.]